jgi:hypothetical protein
MSVDYEGPDGQYTKEKMMPEVQQVLFVLL